MIRKPVALVGNTLQIEAPLGCTAADLARIQQELRTIDPACTVRAGPGSAAFTVVFEGREFTSFTGVCSVPLRA